MEDSIGTIFYIILAIVALVITALNKKRKLKATAAAMPEEEKEAFDPFKAFEQDFVEPDDEVTDQAASTTQQASTVESKLESFIDEGVSASNKKQSRKESSDYRYDDEDLPDDKEHQAPEDSSILFESQKEESELDKIMEEFDLKRAIIHSEIINRKEF